MKVKRIPALVLSTVAALVLVSQWVAAVSARPEGSQVENTNVITQHTALVRINEVRVNPAEGEPEFVELVAQTEGAEIYLPLVFGGTEGGLAPESGSAAAERHTSASTSGTNLAGWQISDEDGNVFSIPEALPEVPEGAYVLIVYDGLGDEVDDYDFSDGIAVLHTPPGLVDVFENESDQVALYDRDAHNPETIQDFMAYGGLAGGDGTNAVEAGLWNATWFVSTETGSGAISQVHPKAPNDSLGRLPGSPADSSLPQDWTVYQGEDITPGEPNPVPRVDWSTATDGMMMSTDGFALGWDLVPNAVYHFQLDDGQDFSSPEIDILLEEPFYAPETTPEPGAYFWRVRAIVGDTPPSAWSTPFAVGIRQGEEEGRAPAAVNQTVIPNLTWLRQRKDTKLLCTDGDARGNPDNDPNALENAWDTVHPDAILQHGRLNCVRASVAMGVTAYGGDLSQDRLSYQLFETWGNPANADVGSPARDLGHNIGTGIGGGDGGATMDLIEWALNVVSTTVHYEIHSCGWNPQGSNDHPTFADIQTWINAGRPILKGHVNCHHVADNPATPTINETCACSAHATVIGGWRILADGTQQVRNFDPWSAVTWVDYNDDTSTTADETLYVDWAYVMPASAPSVRSDETSIDTDSDGDGIMDFDEFNRFSSQANTQDTDLDWVDDKSDLAEVYFNNIGLYQPKAGGPDMDSDGNDKEADPDNDGGGTVDGCEDYDYDGVKDGSETSNFNSSDDTTCVPAFEIRYPTTQVPAEVGNKASPNKLMIRVLASIPPTAGTLTLTASDFDVEVQDEAATILVPPYRVGDEYWLIIQPPAKTTPAGLYNLWVRLQGTQTDLEVNAIHYSDKDRAPVDEVLVVDNSGSMAQYNKMVSTKNATRAFIDRWLTHDMVGLVAFSTTVSIPYPLTEVTSTQTLTDAKTAINSMPDTPDPYWYTAIGSGLLNAKTQLATSTGDHPQSIILLSDGMENMNPKWSDPNSGVQAAFKNCAIKVHTVAIGPTNASHRPLLKEISQKACNGDGMAWHTSGGGTSPRPGTAAALAADFPDNLGNRLADIYLSIAELDAGHQRLWEAGGVVGLEVSETHFVTVPVGLPEAIWTLNWDIGQAAMELYDPNGILIEEGHPDVTRNRDATHDQYRVTNPMGGIWEVIIHNTGGEDFTEYLGVLSGLSDPQMWLLFGLTPDERVVGARLPLHVALADSLAIPGANVELSITAPDPAMDVSYSLFDDGGHEDQDADDGLYGNPAYYFIEKPGTYSIKVVATGTDNTESPFELYLTRSFHVSPRAAYVFNPASPLNVETAEIYADLLSKNGFNVAIIPVGEVGTVVSLERFDRVLIGPGTGEADSWGTAEAVAHITELGLPVIGLGEGGYAFFGRLDLAIGFPNGGWNAQDRVYVEDPDSSVWSDPYPIELPEDRQVELYLEPVTLVEIFAETLPDDATAIGSDISDPSYYPIIQQTHRFALWGFTGHPEMMTGMGQEVFVNLVWYLK